MQLALAALRTSNALHTVVDFDRYLFHMFISDKLPLRPLSSFR